MKELSNSVLAEIKKSIVRIIEDDDIFQNFKRYSWKGLVNYLTRVHLHGDSSASNKVDNNTLKQVLDFCSDLEDEYTEKQNFGQKALTFENLVKKAGLK